MSNTLKDKGQQRFQRTLLLSAIAVFASYYLLHLPARRKLSGLEQQISTARLSSQNADAYNEVRGRLRELHSRLPKAADKDHFLTQAIVETLKAEGLTSESILPPSDTRQSDLLFQSILVSAEVKFGEIVGWIARVEAATPYLHVTSLDLSKSRRLGYCLVRAEVSTMIPAKESAP